MMSVVDTLVSDNSATGDVVLTRTNTDCNGKSNTATIHASASQPMAEIHGQVVIDDAGIVGDPT